jgi:hypothetical protein
MSDRWLPILAAVVGVVGGIAGAYIGASTANAGQNQQFENGRRAARQDLRQNTYANYLQAADRLLVELQLSADPDFGVTNKELKGLLDSVVAAEGGVDLVSNIKVRHLADALTTALAKNQQRRAFALRERFIKLAKRQIKTSA